MAVKSMLPAISPDGNLSRYLDQIRAFPMLEPGEEFMLAKAWKDKGDVSAAHKLITSHLRLVAKTAMGYYSVIWWRAFFSCANWIFRSWSMDWRRIIRTSISSSDNSYTMRCYFNNIFNRNHQ